MSRINSALEQLDHGIDRLEQALAQRLGALETSLKTTRTDFEAASNKAKNAQKVGERLDQVIDQLETILAEGNH